MSISNKRYETYGVKGGLYMGGSSKWEQQYGAGLASTVRITIGSNTLRYLNTKVLKKPTSYHFLGDSADKTSKQGQYILPTLGSDSQKMFLIHGNRMNLLYVDGHAVSRGPELSFQLQQMGCQSGMLMDGSGAIF